MRAADIATAQPVLYNASNTEPLASWEPGQPDPTEIPPPLLYKMRSLIHHRRLASILNPPADHESQRKIFGDACAMLRAGLHSEEAEYVLRVVCRGYYRPIDDREYVRAVENAARHLATDAGAVSRPRFPKPNLEKIAEVLNAAPSDALRELRESSPTKSPDRLTSGAVVSQLFPGDPLLCMATAKNRAFTEPRSHFKGDEADHPFIVANEMIARWGKTQDGRSSVRSLSNVGPRRHVVVEFDSGTPDEQAAIILHLAQFSPLRLVVFSGGKSLHAWFSTVGSDASEIEGFMVYAALLGADPATFNPVQLVRTPNAWRPENGNLQEVYWLEAPSTPAPGQSSE